MNTEVERQREKGRTFSGASSRVGTSGTPALLDVEAAAAASHTKCVCLVPPLTKTSGTFSLSKYTKIHINSITYQRTYKSISIDTRGGETTEK